jgi:oligosaccharide reducing-end xylanase
MRSINQSRAVTAGMILAIAATAAGAAPAGAFASGHYRNLFRELLGRTDHEVDAKLQAAWQQLFYGNDATQRVYYPAGDDTAYIADTGNGDVRSEGMSYGMMIAVQLDKRAEFDRLWKWAKVHMYHATGPRGGYFAWQCTFDGRQLDPGSACDGEEWFAMALFFAAHRWGGTGPSAYDAEAQSLLHVMLHKGDQSGAMLTNIFDRARHQVVFAPTQEASTFTDPSYHLPAFYELWARWAQEDGTFWSETAAASRGFFRRAAHPRTGLMPERAGFDGTPRPGGGLEDFRFESWRTFANVALDYAWFAADPWEAEQSNSVLAFLTSQGSACPNQFTLDGKPLSTDSSPGLFAMAAVAGLAADPELARPFVQRLWDTPIPTGKWRYYDGLLYFLGLLEVSGRFQIHGAPAHP